MLPPRPAPLLAPRLHLAARRSGAALLRLSAPLALCALLAGDAAAQGRVRAVPRHVLLPEAGATLPVTWWCDYALATVTIDGQGPFAFLLDTGASVCVVDVDVAQAFAERVLPASTRAAAADGGMVMVDGVLPLGDLALGELVLRGLDAVVLDLDLVSEALRTQLDGVLGYGAFAGLLLELDYPGRAVRVRGGELPAPDGREVLALEPGSIPRLAVRLGGEVQVVCLDTGSGGALDLGEWPGGPAPLHGPVPDLGLVTIRGLTPPREVARLALELALGRHVVRHPIARRTGGEPRLGAELLRHFAWTFDPAGGRVRIERGGTAPVEMGPLVSSGLALSLREGELFVWAVLPGSPAELAGVREGDRLLELNGQPASELAACDALDELLSRSGLLAADLERHGERLELAWDVHLQVP